MNLVVTLILAPIVVGITIVAVERFWPASPPPPQHIVIQNEFGNSKKPKVEPKTSSGKARNLQLKRNILDQDTEIATLTQANSIQNGNGDSRSVTQEIILADQSGAEIRPAPQSVSTPITRCDRLAANDADVDRHPGQMVGQVFDQLDYSRAIEACDEARKKYTAVARFQYQYARALAAKLEFDQKKLDANSVFKEFEKAFDQGHRYAAINMSILAKQFRPSEYCSDQRTCLGLAIEKLTLASDQDLSRASLDLGDFYRDHAPTDLPCSTRVSCDELAINAYRVAEKLNKGEARAKIAFMIVKGRATPECGAVGCQLKILEYYEDSEKEGVAWGIRNLAYQYDRESVPGRCGTRIVCMQMYKKKMHLASEAGDAWAAKSLGDLYQSRPKYTECADDIDICNKKAFDFFKLAASRGNKIAPAEAAWMKWNRQTPSLCPDKLMCSQEAVKELSQSHKKAGVWATRTLGWFFWRGKERDVCADDVECKTKAVTYFKTAARKGDSHAIAKLGHIYGWHPQYMECKTKEKCFPQALTYLQRGALKGEKWSFENWMSQIDYQNCDGNELLCRKHAFAAYAVGKKHKFELPQHYLLNVLMGKTEGMACQVEPGNCAELRNTLVEGFLSKLTSSTAYAAISDLENESNNVWRDCSDGSCSVSQKALLNTAQSSGLDDAYSLEIGWTLHDREYCRESSRRCEQKARSLANTYLKLTKKDSTTAEAAYRTGYFFTPYGVSGGSQFDIPLASKLLEAAIRKGSKDAEGLLALIAVKGDKTTGLEAAIPNIYPA